MEFRGVSDYDVTSIESAVKHRVAHATNYKLVSIDLGSFEDLK